MNQIYDEQSQPNLNNSMKTQIVTMLNNMISEEEKMQDNHIKCDDEFVDEDERETKSTTTNSLIVNASNTQEKQKSTTCINSLIILNSENLLTQLNDKKKHQSKSFSKDNLEYSNVYNNTIINSNKSCKQYKEYNKESNYENIIGVQNNQNSCNRVNYICNPYKYSTSNNNYLEMIKPIHTFCFRQSNINQNEESKNFNEKNMNIINHFNNYHNFELKYPLYSPFSFPHHPVFSPEEIFFQNFGRYLQKENKFTNELFELFRPNIIKIIKNQATSRLSQIYLDNTSPEVIHLIFQEISSQISSLLLDPYANYFCLKIFFFLNQNDRMMFLNYISRFLPNLCVNKISTYPIQCIVERLGNIQEEETIINGIKKYLMKIILDVYGTHVIEKIFSNFDYNLLKPLSKFILKNFLFLANNANGLCVMKKEIIHEYKRDNFLLLQKLLKDNALVLVQNPFGNYALQTVFEYWDVKYCEEIISCFEGKISILSVQKFSSNVIEKCIERSEQFLNTFIIEIFKDNLCGIGILMQNNYGNYVIQKALKYSKGENRKKLILGIEGNFESITDKKLLIKWKNIVLTSFSA